MVMRTIINTAARQAKMKAIRRAKKARRREEAKARVPQPKRKSKLPPAWAKERAAFFASAEWAKVRYFVLKRDGGRCMLCGRSGQDGFVLNCDHIKPRHKFPHLALDPANLQTLCSTCNKGKGTWDQTDWRPAPTDELDIRLDMLIGDG